VQHAYRRGQAQRVAGVRQRVRVDAREIEARTPRELLELVHERRRRKTSGDVVGLSRGQGETDIGGSQS
jgi:hypothetical protein